MTQIYSCTPIGDIFGKIASIAKVLGDIERQTLAETGLTPPQFYVLSLLVESDRQPLSALAAALGCTRAAITGIVDTLEKHGHVVRIPNPKDRRSTLASITPAGKISLSAAPTTQATFSSCCSGLGEDEANELMGLLIKLERSFGGGCGVESHGSRAREKREREIP